MKSKTVVKERPILFSAPMVRAILEGRKGQTRRIVKPQLVHALFPPKDLKCHYGQPGDRLWVRETWAYTGRSYYRATDELPKKSIYRPKWHPSIHMPRWASRIDLEVVKVRVERLQDISEEDAKAEGAIAWPSTNFEGPTPLEMKTHQTGFLMLWEKINGLASWNANPWVWVIDFRRLRP